MNQYLLIEKLYVQNANAIAGLTYGFPAITHFLGFAHALSRKLNSQLGITLGGTAVISHKNTVHVRQPEGRGDYVFALTRNPLTQQGNTAPINEEGRLTMTVSLLIEINGLVAGDAETTQELISQAIQIIPTLRLAGGQIIEWNAISVPPVGEDERTLRRLMPAYALIDKSDYLAEHYQHLKQSDDTVCLFDAWCDFAQIKFKAVKTDKEVDASDTTDEQKPIKANWEPVAKPRSGYLVPITTGYCAISPVYPPGDVANVRDQSIPVVFTEAAYSIGEWMSLHRVKDIANAVWRYEHQYPWYLAKTTPFNEEIPDFDNTEADLSL